MPPRRAFDGPCGLVQSECIALAVGGRSAGCIAGGRSFIAGLAGRRSRRWSASWAATAVPIVRLAERAGHARAGARIVRPPLRRMRLADPAVVTAVTVAGGVHHGRVSVFV